MQFLVRMDVRLPHDMPQDVADDLRARIGRPLELVGIAVRRPHREAVHRRVVEGPEFAVGDRVPLEEGREAVLEQRRRRGMVLDPADHDTWSCGSFFTNPILTAEQAAGLPDEAPRFPAGNGMVKSSAAWLIDHAGFGKGFDAGLDHVSISTKHSLALTNRGGATTAELLDLARVIRAGVEERFGVRLRPEAHLVGVEL